MSDGLYARRAETVNGFGGDGVGQPGIEGDQTGEVHALFALGEGATDDDVIHIGGIEFGRAFEQLFDHNRCHFVCTDGRQTTPFGFPNRRTNCSNDDSFSHFHNYLL